MITIEIKIEQSINVNTNSIEIDDIPIIENKIISLLEKGLLEKKMKINFINVPDSINMSVKAKINL